MEQDVLRRGVAVNRWDPDERGLSVWEFLESASRSSRENAYADVAHRTYSMMREVGCAKYRHRCEFTFKKAMFRVRGGSSGNRDLDSGAAVCPANRATKG